MCPSLFRPSAVSKGEYVSTKIYAPGLIALLSAVCLTSITSAQTSWWRIYGGTDNDVGYSVQQTTDGGYIVCGSTESRGAGGADVWLIKTDAHGETLWTRTKGGSDWDEGYSVRQTGDGGCIIVGYTVSYGAGGGDVYLIKTAANGVTTWTKTFGGQLAEEGRSVQQTTDGGYVVAGLKWTYGGNDTLNVWLLKTDANGETTWTRRYGTGWDFANSVQQTTDGGYIVAGSTNGASDAYLIKTKDNGDTSWTRTIGGTDIDEVNAVEQTSDGGYIITGHGAGYNNVCLVKTDSSGNTIWSKNFGGPDACGNSVHQTADGGYVVAGWVSSFGAGGSDVYLIKTNSSGDTLWTRTYGGLYEDRGTFCQQTDDGGYIVAGYTCSFGPGSPDSSNVYLIKTDSLGNVGIQEPLAWHPAKPNSFLVRPDPFTSFACVPGHETELFALSDVTGRQVAVCKGDRIGKGLRPGVYFLSPVGMKSVGAATAIIKAAH